MSRRRGEGMDFPSVDEDEAEDGDMSGYEQWKEAYRLQAGYVQIE